MNVEYLRQKSDEELQGELLALRREEFNLRIQKGMGQMPRTSEMKVVRRNIARLKTILNERDRA